MIDGQGIFFATVREKWLHILCGVVIVAALGWWGIGLSREKAVRASAPGAIAPAEPDAGTSVPVALTPAEAPAYALSTPPEWITDAEGLLTKFEVQVTSNGTPYYLFLYLTDKAEEVQQMYWTTSIMRFDPPRLPKMGDTFRIERTKDAEHPDPRYLYRVKPTPSPSP
ncbi:MAG: hypothetical protein UY77_C0011G0015 [Candidatus Uhrbacteria bacterium GW2011_GWA2_53_10]|uniref:Uncharacterized protein n=1 Tax=Candidatus Uhrbacteria bacterium GW2011_GWA2_53_10 TaxID=1618980 RepID=A0A0G1ZWW8_9BACT|nr:MAG: hypothetical protein UY77_C0011G0015 [Candidatus Uhrbacteria bacterium GW2011_GWA2_53_10]